MSERGDPICGRCGYDLSGVVEAWWPGDEPGGGAACPVEGVCSECGLGLDWGGVFNAWRLDRAWLAEHARTKRGFVACTPRTMWRVLRPWAFWGDLSMQARVRPWLAVLAVLLLFLPVHVGVNGWTTYRTLSADYASMQRFAARRGGAIGPIGLDSAGLIASAVFGGPVVLPEVWLKGLLPSSFVGPNSKAPLAPAVPSRVGLVFAPELLPWWFVGAATMQAMWLILLALLPATRAVCRVRWAHVARAFVYSGGALLIGFTLFRLTGITPGWASSPWEWVGFVVLGVWVTVWWVCTVRIGWRLRHGRAVVWLLGLAGWLAGVAAGAIFDPAFLTSLI